MAPVPLRTTLGLAVLLTAASLGCSDPADQAAKQRIFSPEGPSRPVLAASEPIDTAQLAGDALLAFRVLSMSPAEALGRLGPHRQVTTASFRWRLGKAEVQLSEQRSAALADSDSFSVGTGNDRDQGLDLVQVGGRTFARSRHQPFRERKRDRGRAEALLSEVYGGLRTTTAILGNRVGLSPDGGESVGGRPARRYRLTLLQEPLTPPDPALARLPEIQFPAQGPDPDTRRRVEFADLRRPRSVEGRLWVDTQTGVPLKAAIDATATAPGDEPGQEAILSLTLRMRVESVGEPVEVKAPADFLPDEDRPGGVAAALRRFDVRRPDAGSAEPPPPDAPLDEE